MSKQASPPPPGDKPAPPSPPPPPPGWRHWLLPAGSIVALLLWIYLPAVHQTPPTSLSYSQFLADVSAHKVKTVGGDVDGAYVAAYDADQAWDRSAVQVHAGPPTEPVEAGGVPGR
jgi:hypothetical protein